MNLLCVEFVESRFAFFENFPSRLNRVLILPAHCSKHHSIRVQNLLLCHFNIPFFIFNKIELFSTSFLV
ncbi:hypothetical protein B9Z55_013090 [Caenorhabditis nigoni]|uniref:Uncharacterized protein n=1 Tax=Caenorhabditis nigoni TaxID=1611254 RepID=A0A2G5U046_9PELO|nr:hypothetical protein B9Z55_013090 [Caenorhabditis nigoni]